MSTDFFKTILSILPYLARGFSVTLFITLCGGLIGALLGICFGVLQCKQLRISVVSRCIGFYVGVIRGTPLLIQVLLVYYVLPDLLGVNLSPLVAGIVALGLNSTAYVAETVRAGINALPRGQWEASFVLGYDKKKVLLSIILPQTLRNVLPSLTNEITSLLKETAILSIIGLGEISRVGMDLNARLYLPLTIYLTMALFYLTVTTILSYVSHALEVDHS